MMKKTIYILILILIFLLLLFFLFQKNKKIDTENILLPQNYTLDNYEIAEVSNISCKKSAKCITPSEYLVRSNCPYTSLCIKNKCNVVCPEYKTPDIVGGDKDIHGCIGSAGYSWCEVKNKCLRVWEEKCEISAISTSTNTVNNENSCVEKKGVWYPAENICEVNQLSESQCKASGGEFNGCASACRHDPVAEFCTMQCVLTCTFR